MKAAEKRTFVSDIKPGMAGKKVFIEGFVHDIRDLGKIRFLILRDITGKIQITALKEKTKKEVFEEIAKIPRESAVTIEGEVKESKQAPGGREIFPEKIIMLSKSVFPLPIDISEFSKTELPKRIDYRYLDLRNSKTQAIFKIQSTISMAFREFFVKNGFIEIQPPSVIASASEGGTALFPVKYFEQNAYLAQSPQLYKQLCVCSLERVVMITPVWRAEKHNTIRHLNESRQMDIEVAFSDQFTIMEWLEKVVRYMVEQVIEKNKAELELLKIELKIPKTKYLSYEETINLLKKNKMKVEQGDDISPECEKILEKLFPNTIIFVHSWPQKVKPFYIMPKGKSSCGFDALYKGIEISSGGQRVHIPEILIKQLKDKGLNPKNFEWYIDCFRYGAPPHAGWSIGLERFTMALLNLNNIREACLFPRDRDRLVP